MRRLDFIHSSQLMNLLLTDFNVGMRRRAEAPASGQEAAGEAAREASREAGKVENPPRFEHRKLTELTGLTGLTANSSHVYMRAEPGSAH